ncbi:hypothetical protein LCC91_03360 [Tepidimonas taiwanensis]|uniref:hypothetical protein n=1 Tax=Tepidimonas taiwanensis TaxID=307486 RepID=UPI001CCC112B|nr:hypothetical protein [Tepidimonas taiwanensis]UBQ06153.1 hypothetical protein LCC91_03360 [Tepidimonas taiwanensis]
MENEKNKLRVLHAAALLRPLSGICTQMDWELDAAKALGIEWKVKMYCPKNSTGNFCVMHFDTEVDAEKLSNLLSRLIGWIQLRYGYHQWLKKQEDNIDIYLLRYHVHDPFQYWFVKRCKKPVYFVRHTLEVPELALGGGISGWLKSSLESFIGKKTIPLARGIVGVTQEIVDYERGRAEEPEKESYVYPNGICYKEQNLQDRRGSVPELLFVANFAPWHGLDRLLNAVEKSDQEFILHLVGKVPNKLKDKISDSRIRVHGHLSNKKIAVLSEQCWVGLASFALDRKNMKQACPLKTREYLMLGLPVYGDHNDVFGAEFPYYKKGVCEITDIIDYGYRMRGTPKEAISRYAKRFIDKKNILSGLYKALLASN